MLLFIVSPVVPLFYPHRFQNIVCYCLSDFFNFLFSSKSYFKTSYVTVYRKGKFTFERILEFQNIVCYCLSLMVVSLVLLFCDFKTSYVTVYRIYLPFTFGRFEFQNIVCYCLSSLSELSKKGISISKHRMLLFISDRSTSKEKV